MACPSSIPKSLPSTLTQGTWLGALLLLTTLPNGLDRDKLGECGLFFFSSHLSDPPYGCEICRDEGNKMPGREEDACAR